MISASAHQKVGNDRRAFRRIPQRGLIGFYVLDCEAALLSEDLLATDKERAAVVPYLGALMLRAMQSSKWQRILRLPNVRPILSVFDQPGPQRVFENVSPLLRKTLIAPQPVIEIISLPANTFLRRHPALPVGNGFCHSTLPREAHEDVTMVRHREEKMHPPCAGGVTAFDRFGEEGPKLRLRQLVFTTRLAANRNEPDFRRRIEPARRIVRKRLTICHRRMIRRPSRLSRIQPRVTCPTSKERPAVVPYLCPPSP